MYTFKSEKELENIIRIDKSIPNKVIENAKYHIGFPCINYCDFENPHKYWKYLLTGWAIWCIYVKGVLNKELRTQTVGFWFTHHGG